MNHKDSDFIHFILGNLKTLQSAVAEPANETSNFAGVSFKRFSDEVKSHAWTWKPDAVVSKVAAMLNCSEYSCAMNSLRQLLKTKTFPEEGDLRPIWDKISQPARNVAGVSFKRFSDEVKSHAWTWTPDAVVSKVAAMLNCSEYSCAMNSLRQLLETKSCPEEGDLRPIWDKISQSVSCTVSNCPNASQTIPEVEKLATDETPASNKPSETVAPSVSLATKSAIPDPKPNMTNAEADQYLGMNEIEF